MEIDKYVNLDALLKEVEQLDMPVPVYCEHEPYRDDTLSLFVLRCRRCPAMATVTKGVDFGLSLPPWHLE